MSCVLQRSSRQPEQQHTVLLTALLVCQAGESSDIVIIVLGFMTSLHATCCLVL